REGACADSCSPTECGVYAASHTATLDAIEATLRLALQSLFCISKRSVAFTPLQLPQPLTPIKATLRLGLQSWLCISERRAGVYAASSTATADAYRGGSPPLLADWGLRMIPTR